MHILNFINSYISMTNNFEKNNYKNQKKKSKKIKINLAVSDTKYSFATKRICFSCIFFFIQKFVEIFCINACTHHCNVPFGLIKHIRSPDRRKDEACVESSCIPTSVTWSPSLFEDTGTLFLTPASLPCAAWYKCPHSWRTS